MRIPLSERCPALGGMLCWRDTGIRVRESRIPASVSRATSVAQRLAGLEHVADARLGLFLLGEFNEVLALEFQQPILIDQRTTIHLAAAQHGCDA